MRLLIKECGGIDILVNSASEYPEGDYRSLDAGTLGRSMAIHVLSPAAMIRVMHQQGTEGCAVNILDTRIADRDPNHAAYHLAKRSLYTLTRDLAAEMAPLLRVNAVAPGLILPPPGMNEARAEALKSTNPMGEWGRPEDVADAVLYLAGAGFVTGQVIFVDGGRHLKGNIYGL
jgi:NAD(P)-dependent dehydrogenase (short-subunit alcohol dehydrogenase family)